MENRDERADFIAALIYEYEAYQGSADLSDKAAEVAAQLRALGHEVRPARPAPGQKERAVNSEPLETAVEAPVKRGRPKKVAE